jgi:uncharacterized membrane protein
MSTIEKSIDVNVPVSTAYNQWTQFEQFSQFMEGVEAVTQIDDKRSQWRVNVGGKVREFETEITEQIPDKRIAWRTRGSTYTRESLPSITSTKAPRANVADGV